MDKCVQRKSIHASCHSQKFKMYHRPNYKSKNYKTIAPVTFGAAPDRQSQPLATKTRLGVAGPVAPQADLCEALLVGQLSVSLCC